MEQGTTELSAFKNDTGFVKVNNGVIQIDPSSTEDAPNTPEYYNTGNDSDDIEAAGAYCLTTGEDLILQKDKVYVIDKEINVRSAFNVKGNGATLQRAAANTSTLTASANQGDTVITVADGSKFTVGEKVILLEGTDKQYRHSSAKVNIQSINGNDITLQDPLENYSSGYDIPVYPVGSVLLSTYNVFNSLPETNEADFTLIDGIIFDGNRDNNDFIYTWNVNVHCSLTSENTIVRNCSFINMQTEAVYVNVARVENCYFNNNNGSGVHFAASASSKNRSYGIVDNCYFEDNCLVTLDNNGHNEGVITWSSNVTNVEVRNCKIINSTEGAFGDIRGDDGILKVYDTEAYNCSYIVKFDNWQATSTTYDVIFVGCYFEDCNDIELLHSDVGNDFGFENFHFQGCRFVNSGLYMVNCIKFTFYGCDFTGSNIDLDECEDIAFDSCTFVSCPDMKPGFNKTLPEVYRHVAFRNCVLDTCNLRGDNLDRLIIAGCTIYDANFYFVNTNLVFENNIVEQRDGYNYFPSVQTTTTTGGYISLINCPKVNISQNKVTQSNTGHFESAFITGGGNVDVLEANFRDNFIVGWSYGIRYDDNMGETIVEGLSRIEDNYILLNKSTAQAATYGYCCQCNSYTIVKNNQLFSTSDSEGVILMKSAGVNVRNTSQISSNTLFIEDNVGSVLSAFPNWSGAIFNNIYNGNEIPDENSNPSGNEFRIIERNTRANYPITLPNY